jgi:hypothetical protein
MIWVLMIPCMLAAVAIAVKPVLLSTLREDHRVHTDTTEANGRQDGQPQLRLARVRSHS